MKQIAACGVPDAFLDILERSGGCQLIRFGDEHHEWGEVKLAHFLQKGEQLPDLVLVGYPGAAGLAACDFLYARADVPPILWFCDREEFEPEARRMGVGFFCVGLHMQEGINMIVKAIEDIIRGNVD